MNVFIPGIAELITHLKEKEIKVCILYGSAAADRLRTDSDIDIAVAADNELSPEQLKMLYLEATSLLGREVDLRDLRKAHGLFLKEILTRGTILLNMDPQFLGNKAIEMMDYQTDLAPHINSIRTQQLQRILNAK